MIKVYERNKKRTATLLLVFLLTCSIITYISIDNTLSYKAVLDEYDDSVKTSFTSIDADKMMEKINYDRDHGKYSFKLMKTIILCGIELLILYLYFIRNSKITIDKDGITVYSKFRRKPQRKCPWQKIKAIEFHYGYGARGLISEYGMEIMFQQGDKVNEGVFIPIERFHDYDEISGVVRQCRSDVELRNRYHVKKENRPIKELFHDAYLEYRNSFGTYMLFSVVIFAFGLVNELLDNPLIIIITGIAGIYFGYRAKIAMNYKAYMSNRGISKSLSESWNFPVGRIGRYFGANLVIGAIGASFWGLWFSYISSDLWIGYKLLLSIILGIGGLFITYRLYLITYIASVVRTQVSYMSLNGLLVRERKKEVGVLVGLQILFASPVFILAILYHQDLNTMRFLLSRVTFVSLVLDMFLTPFVSCYVMSFLGELRQDVEETSLEEDVITNQA